VLKAGASLTTSTGKRIRLTPQDVEVPQVYTAQGHSSDYPRAMWHPAASCNYTDSDREASYDIGKIVIHVAEGSYSSTIGWFGSCAAEASAHYVVGRKGGVAQCVRDANVAWHAGWWQTNTHSIGIEHAGYANYPGWFTRRMYHASARLSASCCKKYKIPVDRKHIIGHYHVPGCPGSGGGVSCHTDPGRYWNWKRYMTLVRYYRNRL
jgi:N-acetyl-anhydromuramyl-L-alanine amidase AmpD